MAESVWSEGAPAPGGAMAAIGHGAFALPLGSSTFLIPFMQQTSDFPLDARDVSPANTAVGRVDAASPQISIQVIARAMHLLDILAAQRDPMTLKDIAEAASLHVSTAHRILKDLVAGRYVERVDNGLYQLGIRLLELGSRVRGRWGVREAAADGMRRLHELTGETVNLCVREHDEIVYVDRAWSERSGMQVVRAVGGRAPLHLTSAGKLFLAQGDVDQVAVYARRTGLAGHTPNSLTDLDSLQRHLQQVRDAGYARDNEELEPGVCCISAGIRDESGTLVAGLSISAPAERMRDAWIARLCETAAEISSALGAGAATHAARWSA